MSYFINEFHIMAETQNILVATCFDFSIREYFDSYEVFKYDYIEGRQDLGSFTIDGLFTGDFTNVIYNQIWMSPKRIETGLVTQRQYYDLFIWNAFQYNTKTIIEQRMEGLSDIYFSENLENYTFKPTEEKTIQIIIPVEGAPFFDGRLLFIFEGNIIRTVEIQGLRLYVIPVIYFIDDNYSFSYEYMVVVSKNMENREQRRLLSPTCIRRIEGLAYIPDTGDKFTTFWLDKCGGIVVGIPIVHEKLTPAINDCQGLINIYVNENLEQYIEIDNSMCLLAIRLDTFDCEIKQINSVNKNNKLITLKTPFQKSFPKSVTWIFPVLSAVANINVKRKSKQQVFISLSAKEVVV